VGATHEQIIMALMDLQKNFVRDLESMVESGEAQNFLASLPVRKTRMQELLATARELPEPEPGDRTLYRTAQDAFADQNIALMDRLAAKIRTLPDDHDIPGIFAQLSADEEMEQLRAEFEGLYQ
jgi:hypothetical protein